MATVVMLEPRCKGFAVGEALASAIVKGHEEMVEFLFQKCPAVEMTPAVVAAADMDLVNLLGRILAKCGPNAELFSRAGSKIHLCFRSAASRGSEEIVKLLAGTLVSAPENDNQKTIGAVLEDAAANSKYELVKCILDAFKARQLCFLFVFAAPVFKKACESNDLAMIELLTKYCDEGAIELGPPKCYRGQLEKKQRTC